MAVALAVLIVLVCAGLVRIETRPATVLTSPPDYSESPRVERTFGRDGAGVVCIHRTDRNTGDRGPVDCFLVPPAGTGAMQELRPLSVCAVSDE